MTKHGFELLLLAALILGPACPSALAQTTPSREPAVVARAAGDAAAPVLLAEGSSIGRLFSGTGGRARVVQLCVVTMCIALFIMMRKIN
jgi:hypothetical protein